MSVAGHLWTIVPHVLGRKNPNAVPPSEPWSCQVPDERYGSVRLHGRLHHANDPQGLVVVVHGLGGSCESGYAHAAAAHATALGLGCLRLNLRGAGLCGEDFYHAGLWQDLEGVLCDTALERFGSLYLLGYSLGGHVCLCWAARSAARDPRVRAVASVCAPVELSSCVAWLDRPSQWPYRLHVLRGLKRMYRAVAERREVPLAVDRAEHIQRVVDWDERIVAPRHGFASAKHYYRAASVAQDLERVASPTLIVVAEHDPMVRTSTVEPGLVRVSTSTRVVRTRRGGHVAFPASLDLGLPGGLGLEAQVMGWLVAAAAGVRTQT